MLAVQRGDTIIVACRDGLVVSHKGRLVVSKKRDLHGALASLPGPVRELALEAAREAGLV